MRGKFLLSSVSLVMMLSLVSCEKTDPVASQGPCLPSTAFGKSLSDVKSAQIEAGFTVSGESNTFFDASKTIDGVDFKYSYYGDAKGNYVYALGKYDATNSALIEKEAKENGFIWSESDKTFKVAGSYLSIAGDEIMAGAIDESTYSWTRTETGSQFYTPLLAYGASPTLIKFFEKKAGHTLDNEKTKTEKGVYYFNTGDKSCPLVRYWFDENTASKLEEAAIYFTQESIPATDDLNSWIESIGYIYTSMTDPSDGSLVYYDYAANHAAYVLMTGEGTWTPNVHFTYQNLENDVPPLTVEWPMPVLQLEKMSMLEAVNEYKKLPYYDYVDDPLFDAIMGMPWNESYLEMGLFLMPFVRTKNANFPAVVLMANEDGNYAACAIIAENSIVLRSPGIRKWLLENGYEYRPEASILPTYVNKAANIGVQFDLNDLAGLGSPSITFQPNEWD